MPTERVQYLVQRFFDNACTPEEKEELAAWINMSGNDEPLKALLQDAWQQHTPDVQMPDDMSQRLLTAMFREEVKPARIGYLRWAAAAAAVIIACVAGWWLLKPEAPAPQIVENTTIEPGSSGAVLTLSDGRTVVLDSLNNGVIATQGNTSVAISNGQLVYDVKNAAGTIAYNTMTTPRGRQFQLVLPDGTNVWLNAASSITYPTEFSGTERKVSVTGEAYFEVAKHASLPFRVSIDKNNTVEVLGTHFNINAYKDDDRIRTTLLQGKVKVNQSVLQPGEQAIADAALGMSIDHSADLNQVMAWKNGIFNFNKASLEMVMKQLERWYNIEVQYAGKPPVMKITGKMDRGLSLQDILVDFLSKWDVKYTMKGRTVTVQGQ
ncbi:MAG TPA: FecR domain-containing protein [Pseudobacter sp.]|nr:FecR domain-containing protein [Pseudobacter sp.]